MIKDTSKYIRLKKRECAIWEEQYSIIGLMNDTNTSKEMIDLLLLILKDFQVELAHLKAAYLSL